MARESVWRNPPEVVPLGDGGVHVWRARLGSGAAATAEPGGVLSPDELGRAEAFQSAGDRRRFMAAHAALRAVLGRYLGVAPADLRFERGRYGKPRLVEDCGTGLRFNMSHSRDLALFAVARGREVGVDVEKVRPLAFEQIAARFFSTSEAAALRGLPPERGLEEFFRCWTRKEAYLKGIGRGCFASLDGAGVPLAPEGVPIPRDLPQKDEARGWSLRGLKPGRGYVAALAAEGGGWPLTCWRWTPTAGLDAGGHG